MVQITGLFVYPVKSCRGIPLHEVEVGPRGFLHDREFLLVDDTNTFITQRTVSELATVEIGINDGGLVAKAAGAGELRVSLANGHRAEAPREVRIFNDQVLAEDAGDEAAEWFGAVLRQRCRLVRTGASFTRRVSPEEVGRAAPGPEISFTDAFPTLLTSEESLADLNSRLAGPLPMNRFRPNIVVRGSAPYEEDTWKSVRAGEVVFRCAAPNLRCVITTIDQQSGKRDGAEPLRTLATYRRAQNGSGVMFGQDLVHSGTGKLRVGDTLVIDPGA